MKLENCFQPWYELQVQYDKQVRACCYYKGGADRWRFKEEGFDLEAFWNGPELVNLRKIVVSGEEQGTGCEDCQYRRYTPDWPPPSPPEELNALQRSNWELAVREFEQKKVVLESRPIKWYFNFGLACNIDCIMCSQRMMRRYQKDQLPHEAILKNKIDLILANEFAIIGGEPLLVPESRRFIKAVCADKAYSNVMLSLFTNGNLLERHLDDFRDMQRITVVCSLDSVGETYEYIRAGANWAETERNLQSFREMGHQRGLNWTINVSGVIMKSSIKNLVTFAEWCVANEIHTNFVPIMPIVLEDMQNEDVFGTPTLLDDIPGWYDIFNRAIDIFESSNQGGGAVLTQIRDQLDDGYRSHLKQVSELEPAAEAHA